MIEIQTLNIVHQGFSATGGIKALAMELFGRRRWKDENKQKEAGFGHF